MSMSVSTSIVPAAVPVDASGSPTAAGTSGAVEGEFSDALAGFLDGNPAPADADADTITENGTSGEVADGVETGTSVVPLPVSADATTIPSAVAMAMFGYATHASRAVSAVASGPLADAAVAGPQALVGATPVVGVASETSMPDSIVIPALATGVADTAPPTLAGTPAGGTPGGTAVAPAGTTPGGTAGTTTGGTAGGTAQNISEQPVVGTPSSDGAANANIETEPVVDPQAAARALGLTLATAQNSAVDAEAVTSLAHAAGVEMGEGTPTPLDTAPAAGVATAAPTTTAPVPALPAPSINAPRPVHVAHQVATQVAVLATAPNGVHTMTIQITPDNLGPIQVQVTLVDGVVDMSVLTALEVGRDTIAQAAPELRRYLEAVGLTCNNVEVDLDNDQSSWLTQPDAERDNEERHTSNGREQAGTPSGDIDEPHPASVATRSPSSTLSGVDLRI